MNLHVDTYFAVHIFCCEWIYILHTFLSLCKYFKNILNTVKEDIVQIQTHLIDLEHVSSPKFIPETLIVYILKLISKTFDSKHFKLNILYINYKACILNSVSLDKCMHMDSQLYHLLSWPFSVHIYFSHSTEVLTFLFHHRLVLFFLRLHIDRIKGFSVSRILVYQHMRFICMPVVDD
jgi:hypothetical protein